jgi:hypothetical protein
MDDERGILMQIDLTKAEAWRIMDAIVAYKEDYHVSKTVEKTIQNVEKKLKEALNEIN